MTIIEAVKMALRIKTDAFDTELEDLIYAALADLSVAGVTESDTDNPLVRRAVVTYCRLHFGEPDEYDRLKKSYDEQKAQMSMATGYTEWTEAQPSP